METKQKNWKLVLQDYHNDDQYLLGFYSSETDAKLAIPKIKQQYQRWIGNREPIVKRVNPEMILNPVCTDYMHYVRSLIPDKEMKRVMDSDASAEICANNLMCGGATYYYLSRMIPKDWTVIDIGCAYNAQSYLFQNHKRHIAIEPKWLDKDFHFEYFQAPNTELLFMTGQEFIENKLAKMDLDLDKTFAIVNYVPSGACNLVVREIFKNVWAYYPA
mgnify:FL=1